jgi:cytoskeletal protein RodZ
MVDSGELHFGWDDERQEFVYWVPEGEEEVEHTYSPVPAYAPAEEGSAPKRGAHRARKVSKVRSRVGAVTVASLGAFLFGMVTEAALAQHAGRPQGPPPNMEQDTVSDESRMSESPSPTPTVTVTRNSAYVPALSSTPKTARHAKPSPSLSHEVRSSVKPKAPGKHRKPETAVTPTAPSANTPQTPPRGPSGPKPPAGPPPGDKGPVGQVLDDVLSPIGRALR